MRSGNELTRNNGDQSHDDNVSKRSGPARPVAPLWAGLREHCTHHPDHPDPLQTPTRSFPSPRASPPRRLSATPPRRHATTPPRRCWGLWAMRHLVGARTIATPVSTPKTIITIRKGRSPRHFYVVPGQGGPPDLLSSPLLSSPLICSPARACFNDATSPRLCQCSCRPVCLRGKRMGC